jgi:hypothetical protein
MLYFTEMHPSPPDFCEINARFEPGCGSDDCEAKIAGLLNNARDRDSHAYPGWVEQWMDALDAPKLGSLHPGVALWCLSGVPQVFAPNAPGLRFDDLNRHSDRGGFCLRRDGDTEPRIT